MTPELEERIKLRALEIWKEEGCPDGWAREHWRQAERELGGDQPADHASSNEPEASPIEPLGRSRP
jgi:hypothetical protein